MADISTIAAIAGRRPSRLFRSLVVVRKACSFPGSCLRRLNTPGCAIGASLVAVTCLPGNAVRMAYVDPYARHHHRPQVVADDEVDGRDPAW